MQYIYFTVDLRSLILYYKTVQELYKVYPVVSLSILIELILSIPGNYDDGEQIWNNLEETMENNPAVFTEEFISFELSYWLDDLKYQLDRELIRQTPHGLDPGEVIYERWIDPTTVILKASTWHAKPPNLNNM
jgi:hypothetical protein